MKSLFAALTLVISVSALASDLTGAPYPTGPDPKLTPGSLCDRPSEKRYPENIDYCARNVDSSVKRRIIQQYDNELGYRIGSMNRMDFKIDHYIPLCAGGSNHTDNLWPQHKSVFTITDPLEQTVCEKMAQGKLRQVEAVAIIRDGKAHLDKVPDILEQLDAM